MDWTYWTALRVLSIACAGRGLALKNGERSGDVRSREGECSWRSRPACLLMLMGSRCSACVPKLERKEARTSKHLCKAPLASVRPARDEMNGRLHALLRLTPVKQVDQDRRKLLPLRLWYYDADVIKVVPKVLLVKEASTSSVGGRDGISRLGRELGGCARKGGRDVRRLRARSLA